MSPSHILEPTYCNLRQMLLQGLWPPGAKLDAAKLALELGVSVTPVRDSLHRLVGERLVEAKPGAGFQTPSVDGVELRGLLAWELSLLRMALASAKHFRPPQPQDQGSGHAIRTGALFDAIAQSSQDREVAWAVTNVNARLAVFRRHESRTVQDVDAELDELEASLKANSIDQISMIIERYHQRRCDAAIELVHLSKAIER